MNNNSNSSENEEPPVEIPSEALSEDALSAVIDDFIEREGTDYGHSEVTHDTKSQQVKSQIKRGDAKIVFDPNTETVTLMTPSQWKKKAKS